MANDLIEYDKHPIDVKDGSLNICYFTLF